ncbi:unnamed protein product [Arctia plantaginis]|uniref:MADF domain-containing protein n=1 Tax=Arctia plantaginis TaxID=874455 RepID=A0A8S0YT08_ARCPL|nr:unnamed protein product [Arctia plantaginis]
MNATVTFAQLKKKWKNLKDAYRKELRKIATSRSGDPSPDDENSMSQWKYFRLMTFFKEEFMPAENEFNLTENEYQDLDASFRSEFQSTLSPPSSLENLRPREVSMSPQTKANITVPELSNEDMLREAQMQIAAVDPDAGTVHTDNEALHQGVSTRSSLIRRLWSSVLS